MQNKDNVEAQAKGKKKAKKKNYLKRRKGKEGGKPDKDPLSKLESTEPFSPAVVPPSPLEKAAQAELQQRGSSLNASEPPTLVLPEVGSRASLSKKSKHCSSIVDQKQCDPKIEQTRPKHVKISDRTKGKVESDDAPSRSKSNPKDNVSLAPIVAAPLARSKHSETAFLGASFDLFRISNLRASQHDAERPKQKSRSRWRKSRHTAGKAAPLKMPCRPRMVPRKNSSEPKGRGLLADARPSHASVVPDLPTPDARRSSEAQISAPGSQAQTQAQSIIKQNIASMSATNSMHQKISLKAHWCPSRPRSAEVCCAFEYTILDYEKALHNTPAVLIPDTLAADPYTAHANLLCRCQGMILRSTISLHSFIPAKKVLYSIVDFKTGTVKHVAAPKNLFVDAIYANQDDTIAPNGLLLSYYYVKTPASDPVNLPALE